MKNHKKLKYFVIPLIAISIIASVYLVNRVKLIYEFNENMTAGDYDAIMNMLDDHNWLANSSLWIDYHMGFVPMLNNFLWYGESLVTSEQRLSIVRRMFELGADPNKKGASSLSSLWLAVSTRDSELVRLFLNSGADPLMHMRYRGNRVAGSPMLYAAKIANKEIVMELAPYDEISLPKFHIAALLGDVEAVRDHIKNSPDQINKLDYLDRTPLDYAYYGHNEECWIMIKRAGGKTSQQLLMNEEVLTHGKLIE